VTGFPQGGGAVPKHYLSAASTNATLVRNSPTSLHGIVAMNTGASAIFLKLFDKSSLPVPGTDTPVMTVPLPVNVPVFLPAAAAFLNGLGFAITGAIGDLDTTNAVTGAAVNLLIGS
jgi:hypothetical protein